MKIRTMKQFFLDSFKGIVRNRIMSIASIGTVAATLFIFGAFMMMALNLNNMVKSVGDQIEIKVYLNKGIKEEAAKAIEPIIKNIPHIKEIGYETKEQALEKMKSQLGDQADLASGMEKNNPLPESYVVRVDRPENVKSVSSKLSKIEGVNKVNDGKSTVDKILHINKVVKTSSVILMGVFGVVALFLIANTIKLTVYARKKEIGIMKYIGATDWFIRWPFVMEGIILGLVGALISLILLAISYKYMSDTITGLLMMFNPVPFGEMIGGLSWKFILVGIGIGGIGSIISLRKFLQV
ncbi:permease-like cell division protein FtsX [Clostridium cylindrosporum]|uniref:Cell division protein FtsX n=1 Tax=Clostridium cylindrosporum DSM 605 TaxID=1121307 RepID=A0A0J8D5K1_CLOCY|nr:permease-like cell division protein FtsX [Clostridium cylindrosporum]KMT21107.1 cell division protein FtsX [Clostridium cylindrosporum DSM 605]